MRLKVFAAVVFLLIASQLLSAQVLIDNTLPGNSPVNITNWPGATAGRATSGSDDFDRPDSASMGPDWSEMAGDAEIFSNAGRANSKGYMLHNSVLKDYKTSTASLDFMPSTSGPILIYTAVIMAAGSDFLFIKVQDNNSDGMYDRMYFYKKRVCYS